MRAVSRVSVVLLCAAGLSQQRPEITPPPAAPPSKNPGKVSGKVTNSVTGEPIKRAVVSLHSSDSKVNINYVAVTGQDGGFQFDGVEPASYFASALCQGFQQPAGAGGRVKTFAVAEQQEIKGLAVLLAPFGAVSGKVVDQDGEPIENVNVIALRYNYGGGVKRLMQSSGSTSNDRGEFRIADIQPGRIYLVANARTTPPVGTQPVAGRGGGVPGAAAPRVHTNIAEEAFPPSFYPSGASVAEATPVEIKPGAELTGIDFHLRKVPAFHIRGRVSGISGGGRAPLEIRHCPDTLATATAAAFSPNVQPDGAFDVAYATPGRYCLVLRGGGRGGGIHGSQTVELRDRDVNGVDVAVTPAFDIQGVVLIEGTPPSPFPRLNLNLRSIDQTAFAQTNVDSTLNFTLTNVFSFPYRLQISGLSHIYVKSIRFGNQDVTSGNLDNPQPGVPLTITLGTDEGEIDGALQSSTGDPPAAVTFVTWPAAPESRPDLIRSYSNGRAAFVANGLPPGDYKVLAVEAGDPTDFDDPDLLHALEDKAVSVAVRPGKQSVQITAISRDDLEKARAKIK